MCEFSVHLRGSISEILIVIVGSSTYGILKKNATICKICVAQSDKTMCHTFMVCLWICAGSAGQTHLDLCQMHRNSANALHFHDKQRRALQDGALRHGHQIVAHTVGEK